MTSLLSDSPFTRVLALSTAAWLLACPTPAPSNDPQLHSPSQLAAEVRSALAERSHFLLLSRVTTLLKQLDDQNLPAVREVYDEYMAGLSQGEVRAFLSAWADLDLEAAFDYARSIPFPTQGEEALGVVIQEWASRDPAEARLRAEGLVQPFRKRKAQPLVHLVRGWVHVPDSGLEAYLRERPKNNDIHSAVLQEIYRARGPEALMRWAEEFIAASDDPALRLRTLRKSVRTIGYRDPEAAADWVLRQHGRGEYAVDGPEVLAEAWGQRDRRSALAWLRTISEEEVRSKAIETTFRQWLRAKPVEAAAWLEAQGNSSFTHPASVASAKQAIIARDPDRATAFCERVPPSDLKQRCLQAVAIQWYDWDPVAAGLWMESSDLDPELRDTVRAVKQKVRRPRGMPRS